MFNAPFTAKKSMPMMGRFASQAIAAPRLGRMVLKNQTLHRGTQTHGIGSSTRHRRQFVVSHSQRSETCQPEQTICIRCVCQEQGCVHCHTNVGNMHPENTVQIGCTDCHGGNAQTIDKHCAHVQPQMAGAWRTSANPVRSYTLLNHESPEFIRS